jgi:hypothetical protein
MFSVIEKEQKKNPFKHIRFGRSKSLVKGLKVYFSKLDIKFLRVYFYEHKISSKSEQEVKNLIDGFFFLNFESTKNGDWVRFPADLFLVFHFPADHFPESTFPLKHVSPSYVSPNLIFPSYISPSHVSPNLISPSCVSSNIIFLSNGLFPRGKSKNLYYLYDSIQKT